MMKKAGLVLAVLLIGIVSFSFINSFNYRTIPNKSFAKGEHLEYRVHYGFINAGYATVDIDEKLYKINDRVCYKVDAYGRTVGSADFFIRVRDTWRSYVDTAALIPHKFYRHIEEGKYRKTEETFFKPFENNVRVIDKKRDIDKEFKAPDNVQDIVSGFYYVRNIDFNKIKTNDTINIPGFLEDSFYELKLVYKGKGKIKNKLGHINVIKLIPIIPNNTLFNGKESIKIWISDDKNRIPVKIEAELFIGAVEIDLKSYSGLRNSLNIIK